MNGSVNLIENAQFPRSYWVAPGMIAGCYPVSAD